MNYVFYSFIAGIFTWLLTIIGSLMVYSIKFSNRNSSILLINFSLFSILSSIVPIVLIK